MIMEKGRFSPPSGHAGRMKIVHLSWLVFILGTLLVSAGDTNLDSSHSSTQPHRDWELVRSVPNDFGGTIDFVLIPMGKIRDLTNYQAAAVVIAGTRDRCMIYFWTDRAQIPTSAWIPVTNLQVTTAEYERSPDYKTPHFALACWLYPSMEAAKSANAFFMPGVTMPKSETTTNKTSEVITKPQK
jgi:hypothetical protein